MTAPRAAAGIALPIAATCAGIAVFAGMDAVMKHLSIAVGAYNALLWRGVAGMAIGGAAMAATRTGMPAPAVLRLHLLRGVVVTAMALSFFWALVRLPMAEAIALSFVAPLIALYLAAPMLGERVDAGAIRASLLGLAGVGVIMAGRIGGPREPQALAGAIAALVSAALYAWNLVLQRRQAQISSPVEIAFFQNLAILLVLALAAPWYGIVLPAVHLPAAFAAAGMAFVSLLCISWAYARAQAQALIPLEYSAFLWSAILGWLVFAEPLAPSTLGGAVLIVAGCIVAARARPSAPVGHVESAAA